MERVLDQQGRWRNKVVAFRMSPEEDEVLEAKVKLSGLTKQEYIIRRLTDREITVVGNPDVYKRQLEVSPARRETLGLRWLTAYSRSRGEKTMAQRLAAEIMDAANNTGNAVKKREDVYKRQSASWSVLPAYSTEMPKIR